MGGQKAFLPKVDEDWFTQKNCNFYQNTAATVFLCDDAQIYVILRTEPFELIEQHVYEYNPDNFGLDGNLKAFFPIAGDVSKMYFYDTKTN